MSSMTSYTIGSSVPKEKAFKSWLSYYHKNEKKLIKELKKNKEFSKHRKRNILSEERLVKIQNEFQSLYKSWNIKTANNSKRESIILSMNQYILKLKVQLNEALDYEAVQKERLRIKKEIEEQERLLERKRLRIKKEILEHVQLMDEESYTVTANANMKIKTYMKEAAYILERVKQYDNVFYVSQKEKFEEFTDTTIEQKLKLFYDNLKLEYGKMKMIAIWTNVYKESLESFKTEEPIKNDPDLIHRINLLLDQKQISENMYNQLYVKVQEKLTFVVEDEEKTLEAARIIMALEKLNYLVINGNKEKIVNDLSKHKKVELAVKDKSYKVVVKINNDNNLIIRFVRVVQDKKDIIKLSTSEKLKDAENMKKWCKHQKDFMRYMSQNDLEIEQTIVEDEESKLLYVVDANLKEEKESNYVPEREGARHNG